MKKIKKIVLISILLVILMQPYATAQIIKKNEGCKLNKEKKETNCMLDGYICGKTEYVCEGQTNILPFAKVQINNILGRFTYSNLKGDYGIRVLFVPPDTYYSVTASSDKIIKKGDKYYELLPQTKNATLYFKFPTDYIDFKLKCRETTDKEKIENADIIKIDSKPKGIPKFLELFVKILDKNELRNYSFLFFKYKYFFN